MSVPPVEPPAFQVIAIDVPITNDPIKELIKKDQLLPVEYHLNFIKLTHS